MAQAFKWDGESMIPVRPKLADETFVIGAIYWLEEEKRRNMAAHRAKFAELNKAWANLPEMLKDEYPSPHHLRAHALIEAGYCNDSLIDAGSKAAAERVAVWARSAKPFAHVVVRGKFVGIREPESQRVAAMDGKRFTESMDAVLAIAVGMIGVTPEKLRIAAREDAA